MFLSIFNTKIPSFNSFNLKFKNLKPSIFSIFIQINKLKMSLERTHLEGKPKLEVEVEKNPTIQMEPPRFDLSFLFFLKVSFLLLGSLSLLFFNGGWMFGGLMEKKCREFSYAEEGSVIRKWAQAYVLILTNSWVHVWVNISPF